jgi:hypothetical protein
VRWIGWYTLVSIAPTMQKIYVLIIIYSSHDVMALNTFMIMLFSTQYPWLQIGTYSNSNPQITHSLFNWRSSSIGEIYTTKLKLLTTRMYFLSTSNGNLQQNHSSHVGDVRTKNETPKLTKSTGMKILWSKQKPFKTLTWHKHEN